MSDKTLAMSLADLDRLGSLLVKIHAIANMVGASDPGLTCDRSLGNTMWAITDYVDEAQRIIKAAEECGGAAGQTAGGGLHVFK